MTATAVAGFGGDERGKTWEDSIDENRGRERKKDSINEGQGLMMRYRFPQL